jgi:hypothetical protein
MRGFRIMKYSAFTCLALGVGCDPSTRDPARGASDSTTAAIHATPASESLGLAAQPACVAMAVPKVQLTTYERCALRAFAARCTPDDSCMIRFLASGDCRTIGGGCWHVCYAYTGVPMLPLPPGQEVCEALSDSLPD